MVESSSALTASAVAPSAQEQFGVQGLTELTMLMGYYGLLAFHVNAFDAELPAERTEPVLPV
jgi:hypothetical protein